MTLLQNTLRFPGSGAISIVEDLYQILATADFDHQGVRRNFRWDLASVLRVVREHQGLTRRSPYCRKRKRFCDDNYSEDGLPRSRFCNSVGLDIKRMCSEN